MSCPFPILHSWQTLLINHSGIPILESRMWFPSSFQHCVLDSHYQSNGLNIGEELDWTSLHFPRPHLSLPPHLLSYAGGKQNNTLVGVLASDNQGMNPRSTSYSVWSLSHCLSTSSLSFVSCEMGATPASTSQGM